MALNNKRLIVSPNKRFLQYNDGTPFFYLADTGWMLMQRLTVEEASLYFARRKAQGFNTIQVMLVSEFDGLRVPNAYGQLPFKNFDPLEPAEPYFKTVDILVSKAAEYDLFVAMVPIWGDKVDRMFGIGPEIMNPENAHQYGQWLGNRYKDQWNIIWLNGGDRSGGGKNFAIWDGLGKGIKSVDRNHLMTYHPQGDASSSMWFHDAAWLDFNSCQSGHSMLNYPNYMMITYDYLRMPVKPCLDSEARYEEHAINWKPEQNGVFDDYDVRQAAYWAVFAGACGHAYGTHPVWQMYDTGREPIGFIRYTWKQALDLAGASQMQYLKNLILSRPYFDRVPDMSIVPAPRVGDEHIRTTRGKNYIFSYLPMGGPIEINPTAISGPQVNAWWFNPRTGNADLIGKYDNQPLMRFTAPSSGRKSDWILVLDDRDAEFDAPGKI
jgi:hypothetical protein